LEDGTTTNKGRKMKSTLKNVLTMILLAGIVTGCAQGGGGGAVTENKPITEVQAEAKTMSADQLKAMVQKYEAAIQAKQADIEKVQAKLKEIPLTELLGEEAKKLKDDVTQIGSSLKNLSERMAVYADSLKAKVNEVQ
jgi:Skp family chaperone for outer membrane proteins